jgi:hypothetical protein
MKEFTLLIAQGDSGYEYRYEDLRTRVVRAEDAGSARRLSKEEEDDELVVLAVIEGTPHIPFVIKP